MPHVDDVVTVSSKLMLRDGVDYADNTLMQSILVERAFESARDQGISQLELFTLSKKCYLFADSC